MNYTSTRFCSCIILHSQSRFGTPSLPGSCLCLSGSLSSPVFLENKKKHFCPRTSEPEKQAARRGKMGETLLSGISRSRRCNSSSPLCRLCSQDPSVRGDSAVLCPFRGPRPPFRGLNGFHSRFCRGGFLLCKLGPALVSLTQKQTRVEKAAFGFIVFHKALVFRSHMWV